MSEYQGTFKRYEKKYLLSDKQYRLLRQKLVNYFEVDQYGKTTICNIYFDTPNHQLIRGSLEKPVYKEKLRLRSYGTPAEDDAVFIELKKKYKGVVYKRREKMELSQAEEYLYDYMMVCEQTQIIKEINWFLKFYQEVIPSMYLSYNRIAMYGIDDSQLRITFDNNILWREEKLYLEAGVWGKPLLEKGERLMEIKIPGAMPIWLTEILDELEIYSVSFSKYGRAYQLSMKENNEGLKGEVRYA